jgi:MFS family permease
MDTFGALVGPLLAFAVLSALPNAFDLIFVASFCIGVIGVGVISLFVQNRAPAVSKERIQPLSWRAARDLLQAPAVRGMVIAGTLLAFATISDGFIYLVLQRRLTFTANFIPLLYVGTSLIYLLLAIPTGRLADRFGRGRVFMVGYGLLFLVYIGLLVPAVGAIELFACLVLFGAYYAATDGVLMALASEVLSQQLRTSGMALLTTATGLARLLASLAFGGIWSVWGPEVASIAFVVGLGVALVLAGLTLARHRRSGRILDEHAEAVPTY